MSSSPRATAVRTAVEIAVNLLLIFIILAWCLQILRPFISLIAWAGVIAIAMYAPFRKLQAMLGGSKKLAVTVFAVIGLAVVIVTHDLGVARLLSDRMLVMQRSRVVETGLTDQVLDDPQHPYSQLLVASILPT